MLLLLQPKKFTVKPTQGRLDATSKGKQKIEVELVSNSICCYEYSLTVSIQDVDPDVSWRFPSLQSAQSVISCSQCSLPPITLGSVTIDFGRCFLNYT